MVQARVPPESWMTQGRNHSQLLSHTHSILLKQQTPAQIDTVEPQGMRQTRQVMGRPPRTLHKCPDRHSRTTQAPIGTVQIWRKLTQIYSLSLPTTYFNRHTHSTRLLSQVHPHTYLLCPFRVPHCKVCWTILFATMASNCSSTWIAIIMSWLQILRSQLTDTVSFVSPLTWLSLLHLSYSNISKIGTRLTMRNARSKSMPWPQTHGILNLNG